MNTITQCDHEIGDCTCVEQTFSVDGYWQQDGGIVIVSTLANKLRCDECGAIGLSTGIQPLMIPPLQRKPVLVKFSHILWLISKWLLRKQV